MKDNQIIHKLSFFAEEPATRQDQVKETREILQVNEKIKAMVTLRKLQQYSKISQYIRRKNQDHKVKKTLYLRNKFLDNTASDKKFQKQKSDLSIDNGNKLKQVYVRKMPEQHRHRIDYVDALLQFEEDFSKGLMEKEYQQLLETHLQQFNQQMKNQDRMQIIKLTSKTIKEKLFNTYLKKYRKKRHKLNQGKSSSILSKIDSNGSINQLSKEQNDLSKQYRIKQHFSTKISPDSKMDRIKEDEVSYIYKKRSKFSDRRLSSINKLYYEQIDNLDLANDMGYKTRRINEFIFLKRFKDHRNTTYRSVADHKDKK